MQFIQAGAKDRQRQRRHYRQASLVLSQTRLLTLPGSIATTSVVTTSRPLPEASSGCFPQGRDQRLSAEVTQRPRKRPARGPIAVDQSATGSILATMVMLHTRTRVSWAPSLVI